MGEEGRRSLPVPSTPACCGTTRAAPLTATHFSAAPPLPATCPPPSAQPRASRGAPSPPPRPPPSPPPPPPHPHLPSSGPAPPRRGPNRWCSRKAAEEPAAPPWVPRPLLCPLRLLPHPQATHTLSLTPLHLHLHPSLTTNPARLRILSVWSTLLILTNSWILTALLAGAESTSFVFTRDLTHYSCVAFTSRCPGEFLRRRVPFRVSRVISALSLQLYHHRRRIRCFLFLCHHRDSRDRRTFKISYKGTGLRTGTYSLHTLVCDVWNVFEWACKRVTCLLHTELSEEQKALFDFCIVDMTEFFCFVLFFFLMTHD